MSIEKLRELALSVRNWGKWGPDDEIGTLNYITPERVAAACRLATAGKVFSLGVPLQRRGPQSGTRDRFNPIHTMFRDGGDAPRDEAGVLQQYDVELVGACDPVVGHAGAILRDANGVLRGGSDPRSDGGVAAW